MCQNIVGSETHVNSMRLMHTVKDNVSSNTKVTVITSGSFGEGLELRGSDLDVMYVTKSIEVFEDFKTAYTTVYLCLEMETDDVKPGFTQLLIEQIHTQFPCKHCEEHNGKHYFSGTSFKQEIMENTDTIVHGPCVSDKEGKWDQAMCLHCRTWISQASQWITRSNNSWPSYSVKQSIIKHGVLFVPIGVKGSPKEDIEWRISFSVGEKFLINTFTHTQLICYALLKILLKDVIATYAECENLLCSYFLKTIIFWVSEELPQSIWKPENLIHCFMRCFSRLIYSVDYSICLHYFIPENNMFEDKIQGHAHRETKTKSLALYRFMCFNIVGIENHVKTLRLMNTVRDVMTNNNHYTTITSGSFGEGFELKGSDLDMMSEAKFIEVDTDGIKPRLNPNLIYLRTETDDLKPGFTQMVVELTDNQSLLQFCEKLNGKLYLSRTLFKKGFLGNTMNIYGSKIHGPSISDKDGIKFFAYIIFFHSKSYKILGIALQLLGESESDRHAFKRSVKIDADKR
ncbi:uncharacterized protein LOC134697908 [Mytilus trossulus]|uniref:uncharacterized protein LOC134697908 n=1 Tax=Mytilus trossulus TaxID=6551 RepID=UPI0030076C63